MILKILAGIILWLIVTLLISVFIGSSNEYLEFRDAFLAANIGLLLITAVGIIFFKVLPWVFQVLFG